MIVFRIGRGVYWAMFTEKTWRRLHDSGGSYRHFRGTDIGGQLQSYLHRLSCTHGGCRTPGILQVLLKWVQSTTLTDRQCTEEDGQRRRQLFTITGRRRAFRL